LVRALQLRVPGHPTATKGPGPTSTVRYATEGTPVVFEVTFAAGRIAVQASRDPDGIVWGAREHPISTAGVAQAVAEMVEWWGQLPRSG
ncbi:MAG: hypothetical protein FWD17_08835, partial [Polyangiaceae bacterium]|nr:hypothetical protein [Polyangiaceae bacterium]